MRGSRISVQKLSVHYDGKQVLDNISMEIESSAVTALIGPSGVRNSQILFPYDKG